MWPPADAELMIEFVVLGSPKTAGSKTSFVPKRKDGSIVTRDDGSPMVVTHDSSGQAGEVWRSAVAQAAFDAMGGEEPTQDALAVELTFYRQRPKSHYRTGKNAGLLKDAAPAFPVTKPDSGKLARAVHDAMTTIVYADDSQVVDSYDMKRFGVPERCEVRIFRVPSLAFAGAPDGQESLLAAAR